MSYADATAMPGVAYEYSLQATRTSTPTIAYGAIVAGYDIPLNESRGHVIVLVEDTMSAALGAELERLENDLIADGWEVHRRNVQREQVPVEATGDDNVAARLAERVAVRRIIQDLYATAPDAEWSLLIFGRVPVVFSGNTGPDGHGDRAWPTDAYYADINGSWTDSRVNSTTWSDQAYRNVPGDGKFDPSVLPTSVELCVGRVDMARLDGIGTGLTETEKLRRYLVRDHQFRRALAPYDTVTKQLIVDDNFTYLASEAFSSSGWRAGISFFGSDSSAIRSADWFSTLQSTPVLLAYGCGSGTYTSISGVGAYVDFDKYDSKAVFNMLFGSYFGSWDSTNSILRAPLTGTADSLGLVSLWSGRGYFHLQHMALGETVGYSARFSQNFQESPYNGGWYHNSYYRYISYNLMGDPTLRLHAMRAPTGVVAVSKEGGVALEWNASPDAGLGYHVYRSDAPSGPFTRVTGTLVSEAEPSGAPLTETVWTDSTAVSGKAYTWLVKAVRRETGASGTYINQSLGEAVTHTHQTSGQAIPSMPIGLTVNVTGTVSRSLAWTDTNGGEAATIVQRYNVISGAWETIATVPAGAVEYLDGAADAGVITHYRVRAENVNGASAWTGPAGDETLIGRVHFTALTTTIERPETATLPALKRIDGSSGDVSATVIGRSLFNPSIPNGDFEQWSLIEGTLSPDAWSVAGASFPLPAPGIVTGSVYSAWVPAADTELSYEPAKQEEVCELSFTVAATDPGSSTEHSFNLVVNGRTPEAGGLTSLMNLRLARGSSADWLSLEIHDGQSWRSVVTDVVRASVYDEENQTFFEVYPLVLTLRIDLPGAIYDLSYNVPGEAPVTRTLSYFQYAPGSANGVRLARFSFEGKQSASGYAVDDVSLLFRAATASAVDPVAYQVSWPHGGDGYRKFYLDLPAVSSGPVLTEVIETALDNPTNGLGLAFPNRAYLFLRDPDAETLPEPWTTGIIGTNLPDEGYAEYAEDTFGIKVRSDKMYGSKDSLRLISRPVTGDFQFTARLHIDAAITPGARMGLMARTSLSDGAVMDAMMMQTPTATNTFAMYRYRRASADAPLKEEEIRYARFPHPIWMRMVRSGDIIQTYFSRDGNLYKEFATTYVLGSADTPLHVGMAVASGTPYSGGVNLHTYARFDCVEFYTPPAVPEGLVAVVGPGTVAMSWNAAVAATLYRVERIGPGETAFSVVAETDDTAWTDMGLMASETYTYRVYALNPAYESSASAEVTAKPEVLSAYASWAATYAFTGPDEALPAADPDDDRLANALEYALGLDPLAADWANVPELGLSANHRYLTLTFNRIDDPQILYRVEATNHLLASWGDVWSSTGAENVAGPVTVMDTQPLDFGSCRFLRLRVEFPEP